MYQEVYRRTFCIHMYNFCIHKKIRNQLNIFNKELTNHGTMYNTMEFYMYI